MSTTEETTMTITTPDGGTTGPIPMERLTRQLAMFEGRSYPDVEIKLTGGIEGDTLSLLPEVTGERIGEPFTLVVSGEVISKLHKLKRDSEGDEVRVLVVTLKVDAMRLPDEG